MLKNRTINLKVVEEVALALGTLNQEVVFVGGAVVSLYADDPGAEEARPTKDIDISVQISSYAEMDNLREQLAKRNIFPAINESVMYRYRLKDILLDFIPTEETTLGPANSWLKAGYEHRVKIELNGEMINILPVSYYLASKWEAFEGRGNDKRTSHDFEDIVYVLDNHLNIVDKVLNSETQVKTFIIDKCMELLGEPYVDEILSCHINPYTVVERKKMIIQKLEAIVNG